ncbi:hypothetical protein BC826DRAFT_739272 [Russula brevipes]|nr:hypothetical protein BC826DRAFT_739272 [Russula brevipes]
MTSNFRALGKAPCYTFLFLHEGSTPLLSVIFLCGYARISTDASCLPIESASGSNTWRTSSLSPAVMLKLLTMSAVERPAPYSTSERRMARDFGDRHSDTTNDGGADDDEGTDTGTITGIYGFISEPDTHSMPPQLKLPRVNSIAGPALPTDASPNPHPNQPKSSPRIAKLSTSQQGKIQCTRAQPQQYIFKGQRQRGH